MSNDKLCKRYLFNLEMIVKDKAAANKKIEGPPRMLYLRELYTSIHQIFKEQVLAVVRSSPDGCCPPLPRRSPTHTPTPPPSPTRVRFCPTTCCRALHTTKGDARSHTHLLPAGPLPAPLTSLPPPHMHRAPAHLHGQHTTCTGTAPELPTHIPRAHQRFPAQHRPNHSCRRAQAGPEAMLAGDKCVLMKERGVMVVGLSLQEWRVLLEKNTGSDKMQMISGVEEAVMRGLSQSEGTSDSQTDLKASWNSWALKLCEVEGGSPHLRSKCLLQSTVLLLQLQMHHKALESATEVLKLCPDSKHASALLATSQHKAGKKKAAAATVSELVVAFMRPEDTNMLSDELGCAPAPVTVRGDSNPCAGFTHPSTRTHWQAPTRAYCRAAGGNASDQGCAEVACLLAEPGARCSTTAPVLRSGSPLRQARPQQGRAR